MKKLYQKFFGAALLAFTAFMLWHAVRGTLPAGVHIAPLMAAAPLGAALLFARIDFFSDLDEE